MAYNTDNLNLFCYDTIFDIDEIFSVEQALNDNWVILDNAYGNLTNLIPTKTSQLTNDSGFLTQHQSLANYAPKANPTLTGTVKVPNSATVGTAVSTAAISKAANGYVKFGNGIIIQWGIKNATTTTQHGGVDVTLPTSFSNAAYQLAFGLCTKSNSGGIDFQDTGFVSRATTKFVLRMENTDYMAACSWIAIGY